MPDRHRCRICGTAAPGEAALHEHLLGDHSLAERLQALAADPTGGPPHPGQQNGRGRL